MLNTYAIQLRDENFRAIWHCDTSHLRDFHSRLTDDYRIDSTFIRIDNHLRYSCRFLLIQEVAAHLRHQPLRFRINRLL
ncbi:hypothetical protein D3C71_2074260 [compost metagenome]